MGSLSPLFAEWIPIENPGEVKGDPVKSESEVTLRIQGAPRSAAWRFGPVEIDAASHAVVAQANVATDIPQGQTMRLSLYVARGTDWPSKAEDIISQQTLTLKGHATQLIGFRVVIPRDAKHDKRPFCVFVELSSVGKTSPATGTVTLRNLSILCSRIKAAASSEDKRRAYLAYAAMSARWSPDFRPSKPNKDIFRLPGLLVSILEVKDPQDPRLAYFFSESSRLIQALDRPGNRNGPFEYFLPIATYTVAKKTLGQVFTQSPGFDAYRRVVLAHQSLNPNYASGGSRLFAPGAQFSGPNDASRHIGNGNFNLLDSASGLLSAQEFSELETKEVNGKTGGVRVRKQGEILKEMHVYLRALFHSILTRNTEEYGSPIYLAIDFAPIRMVAEYAQDPEIRKMAADTLTWLYISTLASWNQGHYVNSAARSKGDFLGDRNDLSLLPWLLFDVTESASGAGTPFNILMATPGAFRLPDVVKPFTDLPFVKRETSGRAGAVYIYTFQSKSFGLTCSMEDMNGVGHFNDPKWDRHGFYKEAARNKLNWFADKPGAFSPQWEDSAQPYANRRNQPNMPYYGVNPWSYVLQCRGTQIGLSDVRETYPFRKLYVSYPNSIRLRVAKPDGWILCHTGAVMFAFRSLKPPTQAGSENTGAPVTDYYDYKRTAWILEVVEAPTSSGSKSADTLARELDGFHKLLIGAEIQASNLNDADPAPPVLVYTSPITHKTLKLDASVYPIPADGEGMPLAQYPLLATYPDNPKAPRILHVGSKLQWLDGSGKPLHVIDAGRWLNSPWPPVQ
jgi:hypothetical protein